MDTIVKHLKDLLTTQLGTGNLLSYISKVYDDDIDSLFQTDIPTKNFLCIEAGSPESENLICRTQRQIIPINIYICFISQAGVNLQMGNTIKNKTGTLSASEDVKNFLLQNHVQESGYWARLQPAGSDKWEATSPKSQNLKGRVLSFEITRDIKF